MISKDTVTALNDDSVVAGEIISGWYMILPLALHNDAYALINDYTLLGLQFNIMSRIP